MPITSNVAWDTRLETFKGRDTAQYIETVLAMAGRCAACLLPLGPGAAVSLTVDITEGRDLEGTMSLTFDSAVYHVQCQEPGLRVHQSAGIESDLASVGARLVLPGGALGQMNIPVLAYTLVPSLVFGEPGGEMTSALVSALLNHGFQMSLTGQLRRDRAARCSRAGHLHLLGGRRRSNCTVCGRRTHAFPAAGRNGRRRCPVAGRSQSRSRPGHQRRQSPFHKDRPGTGRRGASWHTGHRHRPRCSYEHARDARRGPSPDGNAGGHDGATTIHRFMAPVTGHTVPNG
jgi:hypothetical protein